jgi:hypothetical protein
MAIFRSAQPPIFLDQRQMAQTFVYRCPNTGQHVQGWVADDADDSNDRFHTIKCLACSRMHTVNRKTGKVLGQGEE